METFATKLASSSRPTPLASAPRSLSFAARKVLSAPCAALTVVRKSFVAPRRLSFSSASPALRSTRSSVIAMASSTSSSPQVEVWVKGDPKTETLLDCPFCHRVLLAAGEKKVPISLGYIDFAAKPEWLLKVNPQGSVPVAKDLRPTASEKESPWVVDSGTICDWLESDFPSPPSVGAVEDAASAPGGDVFPAFAGFIKAAIGSPEEAEKRKALDEAVVRLSEAIESSGKPFLGGDSPKQADFALVPKLHHLSIAAPAHKSWSWPAKSEAVVAYLDRWRARPSWKAHEYSDESVVTGWKKNVGIAK